MVVNLKFKIQNSKLDPITARINRVEGQVAGIKRMYQAGKKCTDIVQQVQAARAALGKLASVLLTDEAKRCADAGDIKELERVVNRTFKTI